MPRHSLWSTGEGEELSPVRKDRGVHAPKVFFSLKLCLLHNAKLRKPKWREGGPWIGIDARML